MLIAERRRRNSSPRVEHPLTCVFGAVLLQATDEYINWYKANALAREQPAADAPGGEAGAEPNEARDAASAKVASLLVGRAPVAPSLDAAAAANEFLSSLGGPAVEAKVER